MGAKVSGDSEQPADQAPTGHADTGADSNLDTIEVSGSIKWFDAGKGFGFIVPDNGMADVLLHVTCLRRDGYQTAYEGARIVVEALNRPGACRLFASSRWTNRPPAIRRRCHRRAPTSSSSPPPAWSGLR